MQRIFARHNCIPLYTPGKRKVLSKPGVQRHTCERSPGSNDNFFLEFLKKIMTSFFKLPSNGQKYLAVTNVITTDGKREPAPRIRHKLAVPSEPVRVVKHALLVDEQTVSNCIGRLVPCQLFDAIKKVLTHIGVFTVACVVEPDFRAVPLLPRLFLLRGVPPVQLDPGSHINIAP